MKSKPQEAAKAGVVPQRCRSLVRQTEMPSLTEAPRNAVVVEARGPFAVALCRGGLYLGLHRRGNR